MIKKPVRLEEQPPCRQTLPGRSGRSDAPAKMKAREEAARTVTTQVYSAGTAKGGDETSETVAVVRETAIGSANIVKKSGEDNREGGAGAERCVARLGTAAIPEAGTDRLLWSSDGSDETHGAAAKVGATRTSARGGKRGTGTVDLATSNGSNGNSSTSRTGGVVGSRGATGGAGSSGGSVVRTALPAAGRTAGVSLAPSRAAAAVEDNDEGSGSGEVGMEAGAGGGKGARVGRATIPDPPPVRPVGGFGEHPEDAIKEYKRAYDDVRWRTLCACYFCPWSVGASRRRWCGRPHIAKHSRGIHVRALMHGSCCTCFARLVLLTERPDSQLPALPL